MIQTILSGTWLVEPKARFASRAGDFSVSGTLVVEPKESVFRGESAHGCFLMCPGCGHTRGCAHGVRHDDQMQIFSSLSRASLTSPCC